MTEWINEGMSEDAWGGGDVRVSVPLAFSHSLFNSLWAALQINDLKPGGGSSSLPDLHSLLLVLQLNLLETEPTKNRGAPPTPAWLAVFLFTPKWGRPISCLPLQVHQHLRRDIRITRDALPGRPTPALRRINMSLHARQSFVFFKKALKMNSSAEWK